MNQSSRRHSTNPTGSMSPSPQLAPPGSSTYNSHTLHVGDGTWDAGRDDFLLPPLVGVNFATMRYNGERADFQMCDDTDGIGRNG